MFLHIDMLSFYTGPYNNLLLVYVLVLVAVSVNFVVEMHRDTIQEARHSPQIIEIGPAIITGLVKPQQNSSRYVAEADSNRNGNPYAQQFNNQS